jgi:putative oxidoreductase
VRALHTLLRLVLGATFIAHGGQKLLGWFGGGGLGHTEQEMREIGLEPARAHAVAVAATQFGGGAMLGAGLLTPVACTMTSSSMLTAIWAKNLGHGFFSREGGYEYPLLLTLGLAIVAGAGPGRMSADRALGIEASGGAIALATLAAATAGSAGVYAIARRASSS